MIGGNLFSQPPAPLLVYGLRVTVYRLLFTVGRTNGHCNYYFVIGYRTSAIRLQLSYFVIVIVNNYHFALCLGSLKTSWISFMAWGVMPSGSEPMLQAER